MFLRELGQSVTVLSGVGRSIAERLARLGASTVADLLLRYPRDYDDRSSFVPLASFASAERVHTIAEVVDHEWFGFARMRTLKIRIRDESGTAILVCFNRPFLEQSLPIGARAVVTGKFQYRYGDIQSSSFEAERLEGESAGASAILPVYPLTEGLQQGQMRRLVKRALAEYGARVEEELPARLRERHGILPKREALASVHFPEDRERLEEARRSLIFEELFYFQIAVARRAMRRRAAEVPRPPVLGLLKSRLVERLPFELTADQVKASEEIARDMGGSRPMSRLLQGDVGSGKTLVAFLACLDAIEAGGQAAFMAPTELLARQHAATAARLLEPLGVRLAFLSGNVEDAARPPLLAALREGRIDLVLGTQALFSEEVEYRRLSLAVVDEQHRFGVLQRLALGRKGSLPDLLMMTATPIPRTLALTVFGDLEVSTIRTMPPGRKSVVTHLTKVGNEGKVYEFVRGLLAAGRQAYFVYPLIGESERLELKNAEAMAEHLRSEVYPEFPLGLIHSRLKDEEKRRAMDDFVAGRTRILVATSVVEVGVDVPNAAAMVVEHAERFGLAALHQLRGRVGRGSDQSYCFLVYADGLTADAKARLKAMLASTDGFALAEEDLRIRGPGELAGTAQSGYLRLTIADPVRDARILETARAEAFATIEADPALLSADNAVLREVLERANPFADAPVGHG
ncbi:MAG TPA: ATP-dependent DNA helicase RecG [Rectinemataceae bacterium]|nr:ATP-dependent DNA helicase RecG [Rectinemataceae bacterium]